MPTIRQKHKEIYWCWKAMKQRCLNPKAQAYKNYGKRGIGVCDQWMTFEPFLDWCLHHGWRKGLDLDRIDNDGDYTPNNCRFVTRQQNTNNRRCTLWLEIDNKKKTVNEWAKKIGVDRALNHNGGKTHKGYFKKMLKG